MKANHSSPPSVAGLKPCSSVIMAQAPGLSGCDRFGVGEDPRRGDGDESDTGPHVAEG